MAPVRLGIVGCGAVAQVQHLPNLLSLQEEFDVVAACDLSPALARTIAQKFRIPCHLSDYRDLLALDVEAVLLCHSDPKTEVAVAAFAAGKHVFIEKPLCFSLAEADTIIAAARAAGTVGQVGYMKVYDPAFELAQREMAHMETIRFVQVNHLHPDNALHLRQFRLEHVDDLPESALATAQNARQMARREAIGDVPPPAERAFFVLAGSMIHDLYGLRALLGRPQSVVSTEIWQEGMCLSTVLAYPDGARAVASWVDLPDLWDFRETLEIYGPDRRVLLAYPTGFARGLLSTVTIQGIDAEGRSFRQEPALDWESPFARELRHFHECIVQGIPCRTPVESARDDVALIIDIVRAYLDRRISP